MICAMAADALDEACPDEEPLKASKLASSPSVACLAAAEPATTPRKRTSLVAQAPGEA